MEKLLTAIDALSIDDNAKKEIKDSIATEIGKHKATATGLETTNSKLNSLFEKLGKGSDIETETFVDSIIEKMKKNESTVEEKELTLTSLNDKIATLTESLTATSTKLETMQTEKDNAVKEATDMKVRTALSSQLSGKVYGEKFLIDSIMSKGTHTVDGDSIKFGDSSIDDFVKSTLESNKDILISAQRGGSDSDAGGGDVTTEEEAILNNLM